MRWIEFALLTTSALVVSACQTDGTDGPNEDRLPDPLANPYPYDSDCDGFEDTPVAGSMGWFVGEYSLLDDGRVEGFEAWAHIVNDAWREAAGAEDCKLVWNIAGITAEPINCPSCQYSMSVDGTLNYEESDCLPEFIQQESQPFTETYNVRENSDGTTDFIYAESARPLGTGTSDRESANFRSDARCFFF
ncbi:MAG: hypothetical protein ACJAZO_000599 [Myxococcota bacterium]|jgi:hypothetical protein